MMSESGVFRTLDLISSFGLDRSSASGSSETRKNRDCDDRSKKEKRREVVFSGTVEMPAALRDRIEALGGTDIQIVTQKQLQDTDLNKNHGRLSIPTKKLMNDFTTEEEKEELMQQDEDQKNKKKNGMKVAIMDPALRESVIGLKLWKIGSCYNYCLVSEWNSLVQRNSFESGDYIQLWSFRANNNAFRANHHNQTLTSNLCFALVKLDISGGIFKFI